MRREWRVRVAESLGPQKVEVPETVGQDERVAALQLRRVGLEVGVTARLPWSGAAEGTVLAQDPPAHAQGIARPSINLLVAAASDDAPDGFVMPNLNGMPVIARAGGADAGGHSVLGKIRRCAGGADRQRGHCACAPSAARSGDCAAAASRFARRAECAGLADGGKVVKRKSNMSEGEMGLSEDLERVALQERELVLPRLDAQVAWKLACACGRWLKSAVSPW